MKNYKIILLFLFFTFFTLDSTKAQDNKSKDGVYFEVEKMPEYPGGIDALKNDIINNVKYPEEAKKKGIQGKVFVSFIVDEKGKVSDAKVVRGVDPALDKESIRVIGNLKDWTPGMEKGKAVKVSYTVPIKFALDEKPENKS